MTTPFRFLTIAGSDSGGGAGAQADLKTAFAQGGFGMSAITAITAQNTRGVENEGVLGVPAALVRLQIQSVLSDIGADTIKTGMLLNAEIIQAVSDILSVKATGVPVVVDPVMKAKSGQDLLEPEAVQALQTFLFPLATIITPNLPEAAALCGYEIENEASVLKAGADLLKTGAKSVLIKGGHGNDPETVTDFLFINDGDAPIRYRNRRIVSDRAGHGTGCTLSSAIACRLALGENLEIAVENGIDYVRTALANRLPYGSGSAILNHATERRPPHIL